MHAPKARTIIAAVIAAAILLTVRLSLVPFMLGKTFRAGAAARNRNAGTSMLLAGRRRGKAA